MASSKSISKSRRKALARWFPTVADMADDARLSARLETVEILMDLEQVSDLFASFEDVRLGRITNMSSAFGDL